MLLGFSDEVFVVWDKVDAQIVANLEIVKRCEILTLSPSAEAAFKNTNLKVVNSVQAYGNLSHAKTILSVEAALDEFKKVALQDNLLSAAQTEASGNSLFSVLNTVSFFYFLLKTYRKFYWIENKAVKSAENLNSALAGLLFSLFNKNYINSQNSFSWIHQLIMQGYNSCIIKKFQNRRKVMIIGGAGRKSSSDFAKEITKIDNNTIILNARSPMRMVFFTLRQIINSLGSKNKWPVFFVYPAKVRSCKPEIDKIQSMAKSKLLKLSLNIAKNYLADICQSTWGFEIQAKKYIQAINPSLIISDPIGNAFTIPARQYASELGVKIIMFNHASHTPQIKPISKKIGNLWAGMDRLYGNGATYLAARTPGVAELIKELRGSGDKIIPIREAKKLSSAKDARKFDLIFAGNYLTVKQHIPWMLETPDEFIRGIAELAAAVGQIPDAHLTIRVKPKKKDFNLEILRSFIGNYPNVEISNKGSFEEALAAADIMVANISTTIDETLHSGKPVLLHSWPKRYQHLPAMTEPPTISRRSAVYASTRDVALVELLKGIITAHKNCPLTEVELSPYIWAEREMDMAALARRILEA